MLHVAVVVQQAEFADSDLVMLFQEGDMEALNVLFERYRRFARAKARCYYLAGADADDVEQEGLIGLYKAARDFRPDLQVSFRAFAELCITRQIITAIKSATRQKNRPLNQYVSIWGTSSVDEGDDHMIERLLGDYHAPDPADEVVMTERLQDISDSMVRVLSQLEVDVLRFYLEGWSYQEISIQVGRHVKAVDNALQRIKRKLEAHLTSRAAAEELELAPAVA